MVGLPVVAECCGAFDLEFELDFDGLKIFARFSQTFFFSLSPLPSRLIPIAGKIRTLNFIIFEMNKFQQYESASTCN